MRPDPAFGDDPTSRCSTALWDGALRSNVAFSDGDVLYGACDYRVAVPHGFAG